MQATRFADAERVGAPAGIQARVPKRLARIDVAETSDVGLIEKEVFQRTLGASKQLSEAGRGEIA